MYINLNMLHSCNSLGLEQPCPTLKMIKKTGWIHVANGDVGDDFLQSDCSNVAQFLCCIILIEIQDLSADAKVPACMPASALGRQRIFALYLLKRFSEMVVSGCGIGVHCSDFRGCTNFSLTHTAL